MKNYKRLVLFAGHYGSGKTNIAVNVAIDMKRSGYDVAIADLDIVNPYYRTKDSEDELEAAGVPLISSEYANSNVDVPALPQDMYSLVDNKERYFVIDIGGDDRGALALGRYTPFILEENNYEMLLVINQYRPLTRDLQSTLEVMREMEAAGGIPFTGIVNNSNLGRDTTPEDVIASDAYAREIAAATGLCLRMTTVKEDIAEEVARVIPNVMPLHLQNKRLWNN
ncbi:MAG: hypothetical protein MJ064_04255 [Lachnospiraceae bacterium]|nr:hypothetical protein [Lachnospiraceae bacterium]